MKKIFAIGLFIVCFCVGCNFSKEDVMLDKNGVLIDVRTSEEFASGHIEGAINISHDIIGNNIAEVDLRKYLGPARDNMEKLYKHKIINVLGSNDKL
jgi:rhodanese-related sulfurtransferase